MSNPIRDSLCSNPYHALPKQTPSRTSQTSFQQAAIQAQQAQISFVTDEGDVVTLSHSHSQSYAISASQNATPVSFGQNFTLANLDAENLSFSVQGDLSDEELADIKELMGNLIDIATNFFNGQTDAAMTGAMNLGDMGSISQLSATFSYVTAVSTQASAQVSNGHPLPTFGDGLSNLLEEFQKQLAADGAVDNQYDDMLRAQWQQILDMLDHTDEVESAQESSQAVTPQSAADTAHQMVQRIKDTITEHPKLSPFATAFADKAIKSAFDHSHHKGMADKSMDHMRRDVHKKLSDWMVNI